MKPHAFTGARTYVGVYGGLVIATAFTVGVSAAQMAAVAAVGVALTIAAAKASLVAAYFMHLRWETRIVLGTVALALVLLAALMGLTVASAADQVGTSFSL